MPSPLVLVSLLAFLVQAQAFFILNQSPLVRERLDPIVNPGGISTHVHNVVGGSRFGKDYSYDDLFKSKCTTAPVTVDKSSYWAPQLYYYKPADGSFQAIGNYAKTYYLQRAGSKKEPIKAFPKGLRMLAGNPNRRTYDPSSFADKAVSFVCQDFKGGHAGDPNWEERPDFHPQNCPDGMRAQVFFPSCWDGVNLDSADHKSHMAYPIETYQGGNCPSTHPVHLVSLFYEWIFSTGDFPFNAAGTPTWVFANGDTTGLSFHADFTNGWDTDILQAAIDTCGDATGGDIGACAALKPYIDYAAAGACQIETPIVNEDVGWGRSIPKLPGNNPLWSSGNVKPSEPGYNETAEYTSASSTLPDGWTEVGCSPEPAGGRALTAIGFNSNSLTVGMCVDFCASKSLPLASVEYGTECRCDSKLRNGATTDTISSSQCGIKCPGRPTENCGGQSKYTLFVNPDFASTQPILPDGWVYSSCLTEASSGRALAGGSIASDAMTVETCVDHCNNAGFAYAGLEYGRECYCSNSIAPSATIASESTCNMACSGSLRQTCGGSSRLSVYYNAHRMAQASSSSAAASSSTKASSSVSVAPSSASSTSSAAVSSSKASSSISSTSSSPTTTVVSSSSSSSSSPSSPPSSSVASLTPSSTSTSTSVSSSLVSPSSSKTSSSSAAASSSAAVVLAPGYVPWTTPCAKQRDPKLLTIKTAANSSMTPLMCSTFCSEYGLAYSGIEYGGECGCSATIVSSVVASTACTKPCAGTGLGAGTCGGPSAVSIYYSKAVDDANKLVLPAGWAVNTDGAGACITEVIGRSLAGGTFTSTDAQTVPLCLDRCRSGGFKYAGLTYGWQCFCSNTIATNAAPSTNCNMACRGSAAQTCGGNSALNVYRFSA